MATVTLEAIKKSLNAPDEVREFSRGKIEFAHFPDRTVARITLQPGWRWSEDVKPIVGTESCQVGHVQYCISGRLACKTDAGQQLEVGPGDVLVLPPGHTAWVEGNEPCVLIDFEGLKEFAKKPEPSPENLDMPYDESMYE